MERPSPLVGVADGESDHPDGGLLARAATNVGRARLKWSSPLLPAPPSSGSRLTTATLCSLAAASVSHARVGHRPLTYAIHSEDGGGRGERRGTGLDEPCSGGLWSPAG